ncbi:MAG: helix-turn-helix transcriptional regulator [Gemmatimonadales bacterium]|nr:helix-turn-helix transcriptional regulator [Gemmatimonadales bacterium]
MTSHRTPLPSAIDDMAAVFDALGHPTRRRILDLLRLTPGLSVGELADEFDVGRVAVMHHLRQLETSGLVISLKEGRIRRLYHNPVPIQLIHDRWTSEYAGFWSSKLADVKYAVEQQHPQEGQDGGHGKAGLEGGHSREDRGRVA